MKRELSISITFFLLSTIFCSTTSTTFIISNSPIFPPTIHPSTNLFATYSQFSTPDDVGYHILNLQFNTTIPSLNPDQTNGTISSVKCDSSTNSITLTSSKEMSENFINAVANWPEKVILLISHKWPCFGRATTQFHLASNKTVDAVNRKVKFDVEPCEVSKWTNEFSLDLSWVHKSTNPQRRHLRARQQKRITLDKTAAISLDGLFDPKTGKSSKPNITLIPGLTCANCFTHGNATLSLKLTGFGPLVNSASLEINGNLFVNIDIIAKGITLASPDVEILNIPLNFVNIPGLIDIGPSLILVVDAQVSLRFNNTISIGGDFVIPDFDFKATLSGQPQASSKFCPKFSFHKPKTTNKTAISTAIGSSLKSQLEIEVNMLHGLFSVKAGVEVVSTLEAQVNSTRVKGILGGDVDLFAGSESLTIVKFPNLTFTRNL